MAQFFKHIFSGSKPENGELTINLNLTIKIEADGSLSVTPTAERSAPEERVSPPAAIGRAEVKRQPLVPDFDFGGGDLIDFGKNV